MDVRSYINKIKEVQNDLLEFLDNDDENSVNNFEKFKNSLTNLPLNQQNLKSVLQFITNIFNNHHRTKNFGNKVSQIIQFLKPTLMKDITANELIDIFRDDKFSTLYLCKEGILKSPANNDVDESSVEKILIGENDMKISEIIRNDSIDDFIEYIHSTNTPLNAQIKDSNYETNQFLLNNSPSLIEYSAFNGSIRIFKYLILNNVKITPSLWTYSVHGNNAEIIQYLIDEKIYPNEYYDYSQVLRESIKCFNNEISSYIYSNYVENKDYAFSYSFEYHNYYLIIEDIDDDVLFRYAIIFSNLDIFQILLKTKSDINQIVGGIFFYIFNETPICCAVEKKQKEIVDFISKDPKFKVVNNCFKCSTELAYFAIPPTCKFIGDSAFYECFKLTYVEIPSTVTSIGKFAFYNCERLKKIAIPSSVKYIKSNAFCNCKSLTKVDISSCSINSIEKSCFKGCINLTNITLPPSLTLIESSAFEDCYSLESVLIPPNVTKIRQNAFKKCYSLKKIDLPSLITIIQDETFKFCSELTEILIPSSVTSISPSAFANCSKLTKVNIPSSVKAISKGAFKNCKSLSKIEIQSSLLSIGKSTFKNCESLKQIKLPTSVKYIGNYAFSRCLQLAQIIIPSSVIKIGDYAFNECSKLEQISLSSSLTNIGNNAFKYCALLKQITIPSSVISIGTCAFDECWALTLVTFETPSSLTRIESYAFRNCNSLIQISIPSSVTKIEDNVFKGCNLKT